MSITVFGVVFLILAVIAFIKSYRAIAYLFAFSYLFQMTAVIFWGNVGLMPYLFAPVLLILKGLTLSRQSDGLIRNLQKISIVFFLFVVLQGMVSAVLFENNVMHYFSRGMETAIGIGKIPFRFSTKQIIQWVYLALNMGALISLIKHSHYLPVYFSKNVVLVSSVGILGLGVWKYVADNFGGWFPYSFLLNNESFFSGNLLQGLFSRFRFTSIFAEASVCGLFLAVFWWNVFFINLKCRRTILCAIAFCLLLSMASTGFFCMVFGFVLWFILNRNIKRLIFFMIGIAFLFGIVYTLGFDEMLYEMTVNKMESGSADARSTIMLAGLALFRDTFGFGLGLGSSTGAGLATTLLGELGIVGTFLFFVWLKTVFKYIKRAPFVGGGGFV